jgi:hypothetical protein
MKANSIPIEKPLPFAVSSTSMAPNQMVITLLHAKQQAIESLIQNTQALGSDAGIELIDGQILPRSRARRFMRVQLNALHAADRLKKMTLLFGAANNMLFGGKTKRTVQRKPQ